MNVNKKRDKKGVSIMIGYVLLISIAVILSVVAYQWMKTYIPKDIGECPDDVSIIIEKAECVGGTINLNIKNNGLFDIAGIYIEATLEDGKIINLADEDLYRFDNGFSPGNNQIISFDCPDAEINKCSASPVNIIEITPVREQENEKGALERVNCGKAKVKKTIECQL